MYFKMIDLLYVAFKRSLPCVGAVVYSQAGFPRECLTAKLTPKRFLACVGAAVICQVALLSECLVADFTCIVPHLQVHILIVNSQPIW